MVNPYEYIRGLENLLEKHALSQWIEKAEQDGEDYTARIIAYNILLDIKYENISEEFRDQVFEDLICYLDEIEKEFPDNHLHDKIKGFCNPENEELKIFCLGNSFKIDPSLVLGRIMKLDSIEKRLDSGDRYTSDKKSVLDLTRWLRELEVKGKLPEFKCSGPFFWVFKGDDLEECRDKGKICNVNCENKLPCNVDEVCIKLGKQFDKEDIDIIQIDFRSDPKMGHFRTPTVFDSRFSVTFRPVSGKWGKTLNLETLQFGVEEAVHHQFERWPKDFSTTRWGIISRAIKFSKEKRKQLSEDLKKKLEAS